jgi:glycine amidinotransferase
VAGDSEIRSAPSTRSGEFPNRHTSPVSSWNEWDPLEEAIVGTARGAAEIGFEPGLAAYFPPGSAHRAFRGRPVEPALVDEAERQLDGLAALLVERGIIVRRPEPVDHCTPMRTSDWRVEVGRASACPRDALLVVGEEIIEAPMPLRARAFEARAYRHLLDLYVQSGARRVVAPLPRRSDALYRDGEPWLTNIEPAFDAACFARCGRDIFWQPDMVSNEAGADWLRNHLGPGFRIHRLRFREATPMHIDTTLVPIRPGLVLVNPERPCIEGDLGLFVANGWQIVPAPPSVRSTRPKPGAVSNWISMNVLMLDERTAMVEQAEKPMIALLENLRCTVIPVPFDRVYGFGGGLHCCTIDIRRAGGLHSYFPSLD